MNPKPSRASAAHRAWLRFVAAASRGCLTHTTPSAARTLVIWALLHGVGVGRGDSASEAKSVLADITHFHDCITTLCTAAASMHPVCELAGACRQILLAGVPATRYCGRHRVNAVGNAVDTRHNAVSTRITLCGQHPVNTYDNAVNTCFNAVSTC